LALTRWLLLTADNALQIASRTTFKLAELSGLGNFDSSKA